jgi:hypothetical protein
VNVTDSSEVSASLSPCPVAHCLRFDTIPGGGLVTANTVLSGGEYAGYGITVGAAPEISYCAEADPGVFRPNAYAIAPAALTAMDVSGTAR